MLAPDLKKTVGHLIASLTPENQKQLSKEELMVQEFLDKREGVLLEQLQRNLNEMVDAMRQRRLAGRAWLDVYVSEDTLLLVLIVQHFFGYYEFKKYRIESNAVSGRGIHEGMYNALKTIGLTSRVGMYMKSYYRSLPNEWQRRWMAERRREQRMMSYPLTVGMIWIITSYITW